MTGSDQNFDTDTDNKSKSLSGTKRVRNKLLDELFIDSTGYAEITKLAHASLEGKRTRRSNSSATYSYGSRNKSNHSRVRRPQRQSRTSSQLRTGFIPKEIPDTNNELEDKTEIESTTVNSTIIPATLNELNALNSNLEFYGHEYANAYKVSGLKIKYDPKKFFSFETLLNTSQMESEEIGNGINRKKIDFEYAESEELINMLDNYTSIPYRGAIAKSKDASTSKTLPTLEDRSFFKELLVQSSSANFCNSNVLTANHEDMTVIMKDKVEKFERKRKPLVPKRPKTTNDNISKSLEYINLRDHEIKTWYTAPFPEEFNQNKILHICEFCLKYMSSRYVFYRHRLKCQASHPPGNEIYRDGKTSVWEVDGRSNVVYCQNLCLLAKLFLNSKTLYYDVEPFIFYVLTERDINDSSSSKFHLVGYFSQEKLNATDYNLSCILTLPIYQRKGYGHFLMEFSYLLSKRAFKWGTPEKPLSDLGLLSYRNFWKIKCAETLLQLKHVFVTDNSRVTLEDLSNLTGMLPTDVVLGLEQLKVFYEKIDESNCSDVNVQKRYAIIIDSWQRLEILHNSWKSKGYLKLKPEKLLWKLMIFGPSGGVNAVGTILETTTAASTDKAPSTVETVTDMNHTVAPPDFFKKSISMLSSFLNDDISDSRTLEESTMESIEARNRNTEKIEIGNWSEWNLAFIEPESADQTTVNLLPRKKSLPLPTIKIDDNAIADEAVSNAIESNFLTEADVADDVTEKESNDDEYTESPNENGDDDTSSTSQDEDMYDKSDSV